MKIVQNGGSSLTGFMNDFFHLMRCFVGSVEKLARFSKSMPRFRDRFFAAGQHELDSDKSFSNLPGGDEKEESERHAAETDDA